MQYCYLETPIGKLLLAGTKANLCLISFPAGKMAQQPDPTWEYNETPFKKCAQQLNEYFAGKRKSFDLQYIIQGTEFQKNVLRSVAQVPYGKTVSYSDIATQIKNPKAVRAVGMANGANNLPIVIPCHRIIGKNGTLTGFGGGLETKRYLLEMERAIGVKY